ncbi:MAG: glycosyltransferase family 4 protein [Methanothrix sp.]|nr:glycosyltransferase family 4 protein [Methanothrix sp.]
MSKPKLLFITPVPPCIKGPGISIRAYNNLKALATEYEIDLLIITISGFKMPALDPDVQESCNDIIIHIIKPVEYFFKKGMSIIFWPNKPRESLFVTANRLREIDQSIFKAHYDMIHVFRIYMVPYVQNMLAINSRRYLQLDMDDIESITRRRLGKLYEINGELRASRRMEREADQYEEMEMSVLPLFDQICLCSEIDKHKIAEKYKYNRVKVVPNIISIPEPEEIDCRSTPFNFLFIGLLGYYPNRDAVIYFCDEILPIIKKHAPGTFSLKVVGMDAPAKFAYYLSKFPEVELIGAVADTGPIYECSNAVVIPLRAGGGTRIKALEAFAYRKPVISTSIGIEGIPAAHEQHVLIGNTAEDFARQCVRVMLDSNLARNLAENSFALVKSSYTFELIRERLCKMDKDPIKGDLAREK